MVIMDVESAVLVLSGVTLLAEILAGAGGAGESLVEAGVGVAEFLLVGAGALPVSGSGFRFMRIKCRWKFVAT